VLYDVASRASLAEESVGTWAKAWDGQGAKMRAFKEQRQRLFALLESIEVVMLDGYARPACPRCETESSWYSSETLKEPRAHGFTGMDAEHTPDCELAACLAELRKPE